MINLQNKIYGRCFAGVGIVQELFKEKPRYVIAPTGPGIHWKLNTETLREYKLDNEVIDHFIQQLQTIGPIESIREKLNLQPMGGGVFSGLVLKHKERPELLANVFVYSGPTPECDPNIYAYSGRPYPGINPNVYAYPYDIHLDFYIDVDNVGARDARDTEANFIEVNALSHSGMGRYGWQDVIEVENIDRTKGIGPAENRMESVSRPPIDSHEFENFYDRLITEADGSDKIKLALKEFEKLQAKYRKHGAEDTEPDALFHGILSAAVKGKAIDWNRPDVSVGRRSADKNNPWQLYSDMKGVEDVNAILSHKAKKVYELVANASPEDKEFVKEYAWRHR